MKKTLLALIFIYAITSTAETKKILLAADEWCPVTCNPENKIGRGILYDIASEALKKSPYEIDYHFLSWARASQMVEKKKMNGLIGVYDTDFPKLALTEHLIESNDCFYGLESNSKINKHPFVDLNSLIGFKVGAINGYGYGDLIDQFKNSEKGKLIFEDAVGEKAVSQNLKKLENARLDLILENQLIIQYMKSQKQTPENMKDYLCMDKKKIYIAFNEMPENKKVITLINSFLKKKSNQTTIQNIIKKYK